MAHGRPLVDGDSEDLRRRLTDACELVECVFLLAGRDPERASTTFDTVPLGRRSTVDEPKAGEPGSAYLAAIDVLRPCRPGLVVGNWPRRGGATGALHEQGVRYVA